jgi:DNA modification methylase
MTIEQPNLSGLKSKEPYVDPQIHRKASDDLRSQLPDLKSLPGYPNGSDDAIIRMSSPPFYTAVPNPNMSASIESLNQDESGYIDPGPYPSDIKVGKTHLMYRAHSYPTKVPHQAIMRFILHYTKPGEVVLDGFCGTGMTGVAAQACADPDLKTRQEIEADMGSVEWGGRRAILQDLSPAATFIAAGLNLPINADAFDSASSRILEDFDDRYGWMYETTHTDGSSVKMDYMIWSEVFTCPACASAIVFYDVAFVSKTGKVKEKFNCQQCSTELSKRSLERRMVSVRTITGKNIERIDLRPVRVHYRIGNAHFEKDLDTSDRAVLQKIDRMAQANWIPDLPLPIDRMVHGSRLRPKGFATVDSLWSNRSLITLSELWRAANDEDRADVRLALKFWIEQGFWGLSWMNKYDGFAFGKAGNASQIDRNLKGVYYVSSLISECGISYYYESSGARGGKRTRLRKMWSEAPSTTGQVHISTGSASNIGLKNDSIDYIFTDPPFGANIPYSDLALPTEYWHQVVAQNEYETTVDPFKGRSLSEYEASVRKCFAEYFRVLKPNRWITIEFSNSRTEVWLAIQEALATAGFVVADTRVFDKQQGSFRQVTATNAVKRDLVISAYKPSSTATNEISVSEGTEDSAWAFVREHLIHLPVTQGKASFLAPVRERFADRIYDRMVAYHVHNQLTVPLTAAEFYSGLDRYFPERDSMYFLESQVEIYERKRLTIKELVQSEQFITSESSAVQWIRQSLKKFGQSRHRNPEYSEIMPEFFQEVQEGLPAYEQLPELIFLLEQNFLQDESNGWYVPDPRKAADLEKLRRRSLLVEFERYVESSGKLERFRSEALKAGFDDAYDRDDQQTIVNVGSRVPPEVFAEDLSLLFYFDNAKQLTNS